MKIENEKSIAGIFIEFDTGQVDCLDIHGCSSSKITIVRKNLLSVSCFHFALFLLTRGSLALGSGGVALYENVRRRLHRTEHCSPRHALWNERATILAEKLRTRETDAICSPTTYLPRYVPKHRPNVHSVAPFYPPEKIAFLYCVLPFVRVSMLRLFSILGETLGRSQ